MNLAEIKTGADEARAALREYKSAVAVRRSQRRAELDALIRQEDELVMSTYRLLAQGKRIINIRDTIEQGGIDDQGRPKLAVTRADQRTVTLNWRNSGRWAICGDDSPRKSWDHWFHSRTDCFDGGPIPQGVPRNTYRAVVPLIPAPLRPAADLSNYHILWEAEWRRVAPKDPALLKHIGGDLFIVVAVWDLTEVERMALGIRLSALP